MFNEWQIAVKVLFSWPVFWLVASSLEFTIARISNFIIISHLPYWQCVCKYNGFGPGYPVFGMFTSKAIFSLKTFPLNCTKSRWPVYKILNRLDSIFDGIQTSINANMFNSDNYPPFSHMFTIDRDILLTFLNLVAWWDKMLLAGVLEGSGLQGRDFPTAFLPPIPWLEIPKWTRLKL